MSDTTLWREERERARHAEATVSRLQGELAEARGALEKIAQWPISADYACGIARAALAPAPHGGPQRGVKINRSKEWWLAHADAEGDSPIAAGVPDGPPALDPVTVEACAREALKTYIAGDTPLEDRQDIAARIRALVTSPKKESSDGK